MIFHGYVSHNQMVMGFSMAPTICGIPICGMTRLSLPWIPWPGRAMMDDDGHPSGCEDKKTRGTVRCSMSHPWKVESLGICRVVDRLWPKAIHGCVQRLVPLGAFGGSQSIDAGACRCQSCLAIRELSRHDSHDSHPILCFESCISRFHLILILYDFIIAHPGTQISPMPVEG